MTLSSDFTLKCIEVFAVHLYIVESSQLGVLRESFWGQGGERLLIRLVAIGNPERHVRRASHRGSKQQ